MDERKSPLDYETAPSGPRRRPRVSLLLILLGALSALVFVIVLSIGGSLKMLIAAGCMAGLTLCLVLGAAIALMIGY